MHEDRIKWRLERITKKLTLTEIANHINKSVSYICGHENGRLNLSEEQYSKYVNYIASHDNR
ncbi:hypothetical protein J42TS3_12390 [Paenibacillus vini]|uniref:HTH cro/C1-type domain-containing protein n=1 Tax=Paenibacillus vini TaxID=1476024 RepID=A0ABQ4M891_9BACL|nr:hypothetical protein J42TS3_12390 [Paenibacillus vini]